jgi:ecdysteroid 2-hydroxylase
VQRLLIFSLQTVYTVLWYLHKVSDDLNLQDRLKNAINENPLDFESPLVRAVLREVLRLYPLATFTGRILDSEAKLGQFTIPKGWMAIMSLYTSSRDPENFSEPLKFVPDRWLRSNNKTEQKVFKPHGTLPFALGGRSCIGKKVATYQTHCLITKVSSCRSLLDKLIHYFAF